MSPAGLAVAVVVVGEAAKPVRPNKTIVLTHATVEEAFMDE
jgi:hypothetical protein